MDPVDCRENEGAADKIHALQKRKIGHLISEHWNTKLGIEKNPCIQRFELIVDLSVVVCSHQQKPCLELWETLHK